MNIIITEHIDQLLERVEMPGRYSGGERNVIRKNHADTDASICLAYPDTYEVGMPFSGFQILYHQVNKQPRLVAERCYAPWTDMEREMRKENIPLFSLESRLPLTEFDFIGFTLPYELTYTNLLNMLDLAGIPIRSQERDSRYPLIIAGGSCVYNPAPLTPFVDVFLIGDGEQLLVELLNAFALLKRAGKGRNEILEGLNWPEKGIYIPAINQTVPVKAHKITTLELENYPERPIVPLIEITQDRFSLEVMRGCTEGCRFCQAGMTYRPVRERAPEDLLTQTRTVIEHTGYEELSLMSLSTSDYTGLEAFVQCGLGWLTHRNVSVSFPSLRLDGVTPSLVETASSGRKSGFTFAPEAGSQRLRNVINKNISEEDLYRSVLLALGKGWRTLKFYFMVGLPTETYDDLDGMIDMVRKVRRLSRQFGKIQINITLSTFIPKPVTPFQWEAQFLPDPIDERIQYVRQALNMPGIKLKWRDPWYSVIEGIIARGDAGTGEAIYSAWSHGARFDAWRDKFNNLAWENALRETGVDIKTALSAKDINLPLPWDIIDSGVLKKFLQRERDKAYAAATTHDCRDGCTACGVCDFDVLTMRTVTAGNVPVTSPVNAAVPENFKETETMEHVTTVRFHFSKDHSLKFMSHHDLFRLFQRALNSSALPVAYTKGFNRRPKVAMGYPIPMGYSSGEEYLDIVFTRSVDDVAGIFRRHLPQGIQIRGAETIDNAAPSIMESTRQLHYTARFSTGIDPVVTDLRLHQLWQNAGLTVNRFHPKKGTKTIDLKEFIESWKITDMEISVVYNVVGSRTGRLDELIRLLFDDVPYFSGHRSAVVLDNVMLPEAATV